MTPPSASTALDPADARLERAGVRLAPFLLATLPAPSPHQPMLPLPAPSPPDATEVGRPDTDALARQLIAALVEVIAGHRPAPQLRAWVTVEVYELADELARSGNAAGMRIHSIRLQAPEPGIIEAAVHLRQAGRSRAAAVQLTYLDHRWQLTTLEVAAPAGPAPRTRPASGLG
ncbi:MAG: hypothetical protein CVT62_01960 [Actinobacteria bacterium HGW-Actinobacteria-2]|nr:MAG: hypothetical protein CVT62_01960 [Actinobacteria bacterium HGW-Actinobacteria-2]